MLLLTTRRMVLWDHQSQQQLSLWNKVLGALICSLLRQPGVSVGQHNTTHSAGGLDVQTLTRLYCPPRMQSFIHLVAPQHCVSENTEGERMNGA